MTAPLAKPTIHDIAGALGLSASTVSRALSGNPVISARTRERVLAKARELRYTPNGVASALRSGRSRLIGVVIPHANRAFFANIIDGVEAAAATHGYRVLVMQHHYDSAREMELVSALVNLRVDGMVVCLSDDGHTDRDAYRDLMARGVPIHFVDRRVAGVDGPAVVVDDFGGGYAATAHLVERGYRRVAHLAGPTGMLIYADRARGYREALQVAGLPAADEWHVPTRSQREQGARAFAALWSLPPGRRPDAVFSASDFAALGLLQAALAAGVDVPGELGIVGFANEPFTEYVTPALTTVDQHTTDMGRLAAERLLAGLLPPGPAPRAKSQPGGSLVLAPRLIARASSAGPAAARP